MTTVNARDLLRLEPMALYEHLPKVFDLVFDNGTIENATRRRTVYSRFFWEYHLRFPKIPLKVEHHLQTMMKKAEFGSSTHADLCTIISKEIYNHYEPDQSLPGIIAEIAYVQSVAASNQEVQNIASYATSIDLLDGIALVRNPNIIAARMHSDEDASKIAESYDMIKRVIMSDPSLDDNSLARACRNNTVKMGQVLQSVMRGRSAEPSGEMYNIHIRTGYLEGNYDPFDFLSESRSAPKAQAGTEAPLQNSAYMARRFQLMMSPVRKIRGYDCGNTDYLDWPVLEAEHEDGKEIYPGGIGFMKGKYYFDKTTGQEVEIVGNETHLNGKVLKLRSLLRCRNADPHTVCQRCFGGLWRNYYEHQNLGHLCTVQFTEYVIQNTLGIKHLAASSSGEGIRYNNVSSHFFRKTRKATHYVLQPNLKKMQPRVTLRMSEAVQLEEVLRSQNFEDLRVNKLTRISTIRIDYVDRGNPMFALVPINQGARPAFVTMQFVKYIAEHPWETTSQNDFQIDLKDWDFDKPIFAIPEMEKSDAEHGQEVGKLIESNMSKINDRQKPESPVSTLQELFELVTSKMSLQLSCLEVMIYALMIPSRNNHAMARGWSNPVLSIARRLIVSRSLSAAYAFQGHVDFMLDAQTFFPHSRPDSDFDVFFAPKQVFEDVERMSRV